MEIGLREILGVYLKMRQLVNDKTDKRNRCSVTTTVAIYTDEAATALNLPGYRLQTSRRCTHPFRSQGVRAGKTDTVAY